MNVIANPRQHHLRLSGHGLFAWSAPKLREPDCMAAADRVLHDMRYNIEAVFLSLQSQLTVFLVVTLTPVTDVQPFYTKLGWRKMTRQSGPIDWD